MDTNQCIEDYLQGHPGCERHLLAREGPKVIDPMLRRSLPVLHAVGGPLAAVIRQTASETGMDAASARARELFREEMEAAEPVDDLFRRMQLLISDLLVLYAEAVGQRLENALLGGDRYLAIVAAVHAGTRGIPAQSVQGGLLQALSRHSDPLLSYAASASLMSYIDTLYTQVSTSAGQNVVKFATECNGLLPALVYRVQNTYLPNGSQLEQSVLITKIGTFYMLLTQ